jgi:hypothetical protein
MTPRPRTLPVDGPARRGRFRRRAVVGLLLVAVAAVGMRPGPVVEALSRQLRDDATSTRPDKPPRGPKGPRSATSDPTTTTTVAPTTTTTVAPTTTTTVAPTTTTSTTSTTVPASGTWLWWGNADTDTAGSEGSRCMGGEEDEASSSLTIADDPAGLHGKVYRAETFGTGRAEWANANRDCDGSTRLNLWGTNGPGSTDVYIGWRSYFDGNFGLTGSTNDGNVLQWKGDSSCGGPAVGMTIRSNRLSLRTIDGDPPGVENLWSDPSPFTTRMGDWTDFVMRVNFAKDSSGFIELWVDGVPQIMSDGTTRHEGPTVCAGDSRVYPKFGVYDLNSGTNARHWLDDPRIGLSYGAVVPR